MFEDLSLSFGSALREDGRPRSARLGSSISLEARDAPASLNDLFTGAAKFDFSSDPGAVRVSNDTSAFPVPAGQSPRMGYVSLARTGVDTFYKDAQGYMGFYNWPIGLDENGGLMLGVGMARSQDGVSFGPGQLVFGPAAPTVMYDSFPSVFYDAGKFYMATERGGKANTADAPARVFVQESTNGLSWTNSTPTLRSNPNSAGILGGWETEGVGTPTLMKGGSTWFLYYHGSRQVDGSGDQRLSIGVGLGSTPYGTGGGVNSGGPSYGFARVPGSVPYAAGGPAIAFGENGRTGLFDGQEGRRSILYDGGYYYMAFETGSPGPASTGNWSTTVARSQDLITWTQVGGHVLPATWDRPDSAGQGAGFCGPELFKDAAGDIYIYYYSPRKFPNDAQPVAGQPGNFTYTDTSGFTRRAKLVANAPQGQQVFQSEGGAFAHQVGRPDADGWSANAADPANRYLNYGPYASAVGVGKRTAQFRLMVDNNSADNNFVATIEVNDVTTGSVIASRRVTRKEFIGPLQYQTFPLDFYSTDQPGGKYVSHVYEFRTYFHGGTYLRQDNVTVTPPGPAASYEAEGGGSHGHQIGQAQLGGWEAAVGGAGTSPGAYLSFASLPTPTGQRLASFRLMVDVNNTNNDVVANIEVRSVTTGALKVIPVRRAEFRDRYVYQEFDIGFDALAGHTYEFRVQWIGNAFVRHDKTTVR